MITAVKVLGGAQTWLVRKHPTIKREVIALIIPAVNQIVGHFRIVDCIAFSDAAEFHTHHRKHLAKQTAGSCRLPHRPFTYAWVLEDPVVYPGTDLYSVSPIWKIPFVPLLQPGVFHGKNPEDYTAYWAGVKYLDYYVHM